MIKIKSIKIDKTSLRKFIPSLILLILITIAGFFAYNYYNTQRQLSEYKQHSDVQAIKEKYDLLKKIGRLTLLPENEEPTIATVTDAYSLKEQKFFTRAENGDKVIIYTQSSRAILYRPSINKIVESAPVNIKDLQGSVNSTQLTQVDETQQSTESNKVLGSNNLNYPAKVAVYNGTRTMQGMAGSVSEYLAKMFEGKQIEITKLANTNELFEQTIVINITGTYSDLSKKITDLLKAKQEDASQKDALPEADILIIIGNDFDKNIIK